MTAIAERVAGKLQALRDDELVAVEHYIDQLHDEPSDREWTRAAMILSEPSFAAVWDNEDDDVYNDLPLR